MFEVVGLILLAVAFIIIVLAYAGIGALLYKFFKGWN